MAADPMDYEPARDKAVGEQREQLIALADEVRRLIDAVVRTGADAQTLHEVTGSITPLVERLEPLRTDPPVFDEEDLRQGSRLYNPLIGLANPLAPPLRSWVVANGRVEGEVTLALPHEGPPHVVHGGVVASLFDQLLGHAASASGKPGMTAGLDIRFRRPTPYGVPLRVSAEVTSSEGRKVFAAGRIAHDGQVTAEATGVFISPQRRRD